MIEFIETKTWLIESLKPKLDSCYEVKLMNEKNGDFGDVFGFQFDNDLHGGYLYIWSKGFVSYQLVDYIKGVELIEDTTKEAPNFSYTEAFSEIVMFIEGQTSHV